MANNSQSTVDRQTLMQRVQMYQFTLHEAALFLDTHPNSKEALQYYNKYLPMYQSAVEEYTKNFGPLELGAAASETQWDWVSEPWPWEWEA